MSTATEKRQAPVSQWVTFSLASEIYGIDVMRVQEVLRVTEIAPVPGAPSYVLGIVNLRGSVVTVIDTRARFGLPSREPDDASRIVIIEVDKQVVGMLVDGVAEVVEIPSGAIESPPNVGSEEGSRYIQGVYSQETGLLILVDLHRLLEQAEWDEVAAA